MRTSEYLWAGFRAVGAQAERQRIRRIVAHALRNLRNVIPMSSPYYLDILAIENVTKAPRRGKKRAT